MTTIGLDVGGTKIEIVLLRDNCPIFRHRIPTERERGYEHILNNIKNLILLTLEKTNLKFSQIKGIGIGLPGTIDPEDQVMLNGNTQALVNKNIQYDLKKSLDFNGEIVSANDANCFALAEFRLGAGQQHKQHYKKDFNSLTGIGIILGTGCGGGVIVNNQVLLGKSGGASEFGHAVLVPNGEKCFCGRNGCAEIYLSGSGIEKQYLKSYGLQKSSLEIFKSRKNSKDSHDFLNSYKQHLENFLTNLCNIFDPDFIVLGGGVSNQDFLYQDLEVNIHKNTFVKKTLTKVYKNHLGDSAGVIGAALLTQFE